ncbi:MAG: hypothetical protein HYV32_03960 [Candidatus Kerfeldbacteria bacterium]|nr:hypothetical protein [Candidatus Kerfeldbacteria bacterium]
MPHHNETHLQPGHRNREMMFNRELLRRLQKEEHVSEELYRELIREGNALQRRAYAGYTQRALEIHSRKEHRALEIIVHCADGRTDDPGTFEHDRRAGFAIERMPMAGIMLNEELIAITNAESPMQHLENTLEHQEEREHLFAQLENLFGERIRERIQYGDELMGGMPIVIELQSHSDTDELSAHHEHLGCGAWGCNTGKALESTAITALVLEAYIQAKFPDYTERIRITRTHHLTGTKERVIDATHPTLLSKMNPEIAQEMVKKKQFRPAGLVDSTQPVRTESKPYNRHDREAHSEPVVFFSEIPEAFATPHVSRLEQTMPPSQTLAYDVALKLIHIASISVIAEKKRAGIKQPLFLHFDFPIEDAEKYAQYTALHRRIEDELADANSMLCQQLVTDGLTPADIKIICTETHSRNAAEHERLKTRLIDTVQTPLQAAA